MQRSLVEGLARRPDGRFGGTIHVEYLDLIQQRLQTGEQRFGQRLSADEQHAQPAQHLHLPSFQQQLQTRRGHLQHGHPVRFELRQNRLGIADLGIAGQHHLHPQQQAVEQFQHRDVKGHRGQRRDPVRGVQTKARGQVGTKADHVVVGDHHPFGIAGRTRGVDDVGQVRGGDDFGWVTRGLGGDGGVGDARAGQLVAPFLGIRGLSE